MKTTEDLRMEAELLPPVSQGAARSYRDHRDSLILQVDRRMAAREDLYRLIGTGRLETMRDNHRNHARFMHTVFSMGNHALLVRIVPWVYRAYQAHGFSPDYFPVVLGSWMDAVEETLPENHAGEVNAIYEWMRSRHQEFLAVSAGQKALFSERTWQDGPLEVKRERFFRALLDGDRSTCLAMGRELAASELGVEGFYLKVIQPLLTRVGTLWENGQVSVAQEHLASSIVSRVMAALYAYREPPTRLEGRAVVASAANEFHEIGGWMVADLLELHGWEVTYLGANTPTDEILKLLREVRPRVLAISVTMPFNLGQVADLIEAARREPLLEDTKIMVGGPLFAEDRELYRQLGADGSACDAAEAHRLARSWLGEGA